MINQIIKQQQARDIFTKICEKNQWHILLFQYSENDKEYHLRPIEVVDEEKKRKNKLTFISPQEYAKDINFMEINQSNNLIISHIETFRLLAEFLERSNLNTVKNLKFFADNRENGFKKWESILELLGNEKNDLPLENISTVLSKYHSKISIKNYSTVSRDLPDLFKILKRCKAQDSNYDFHPALATFCANHLDQILEKPTIKNFIFSKIKDIVPDHIKFYKEFLQVEWADKEFFIEKTSQYKTFYFNKDAMFKEYPLNLSSPAKTESYFGLIEGAVVFLNKDKILKNLSCNHIELFGKQQKHDNFIMTIDTKEGFKVDLLKSFVTDLMSEAVTLSNSLLGCNAINLNLPSLNELYPVLSSL